MRNKVLKFLHHSKIAKFYQQEISYIIKHYLLTKYDLVKFFMIKKKLFNIKLNILQGKINLNLTVMHTF